MSSLHQDNINHNMCHISIALKVKAHINTIDNFWAITPHGARNQFRMLIFVHVMTSSPPPDHLTPLPFLLPCMNCLWSPCLILSTTWNFDAPTAPSRYASATAHIDSYTSTPPPHPQDMPLIPPFPSAPSPHLIFSASYHGYAPALQP
ncbi:hypothetical protein O181_069101 [Austropuccinia psidii MF-1]|uniref:Uncharacterized protein n=1 Tax=Austropuccinia psidii MF-1 TaxID=1389203 RepID=A0A9Q3F2V3_9BASI|nr:hypothetical protein [Austropuccinia psidii MF-1]